jgi:hypothetical protein
MNLVPTVNTNAPYLHRDVLRRLNRIHGAILRRSTSMFNYMAAIIVLPRSGSAFKVGTDSASESPDFG